MHSKNRLLLHKPFIKFSLMLFFASSRNNRIHQCQPVKFPTWTNVLFDLSVSFHSCNQSALLLSFRYAEAKREKNDVHWICWGVCLLQQSWPQISDWWKPFVLKLAGYLPAGNAEAMQCTGKFIVDVLGLPDLRHVVQLLPPDSFSQGSAATGRWKKISRSRIIGET